MSKKIEEATTVKESAEKDINVFSRGVLVHIDVRIPGMYSKLPEDRLADFIDDPEKRKIIRATYDKLSDKGLIESMVQLRGRMKSYVHGRSLRFPVQGLEFVLKESVADIHETLTSLEDQIKETFEDFIDIYPELEKQFADEHPELYDPSKYPTVGYLRSRFRAQHSFRTFTVPDRELSLLSPEIYEEEKRKFEAEMREVRDMAVDSCKAEIVKKIDSLRKQCTEDTINTATVNAVNDFLEKFDALYEGFVDDGKVRESIKEIREYMAGTEADMLRADEDFRKLVGSKMESVVNELQAVPDKKAKRRIEI